MKYKITMELRDDNDNLIRQFEASEKFDMASNDRPDGQADLIYRMLAAYLPPPVTRITAAGRTISDIFGSAGFTIGEKPTNRTPAEIMENEDGK